MGAFAIQNIPSLIIGWLVGAAIGALLILLGSRVVMGKTATFVSAFLAGLASAVVGFVAGFIIGFAVSAAAPALAPQVQILGAVAGFVITGPIYAAIIRTADGSKPSMLQAYLIYIIQIAIAVAVIFALVTVFHIAVPGMPMLGGQAG